MSDARKRTKNLLGELPLSTRQREFYQRGANAMEDNKLEAVANAMDAALDGAPAAVDAARRVLERRRKNVRKKAIVVIKNTQYLNRLVKVFGKGFEVKPVTSASDALEALKKSFADVVICDFDLPNINGLELVRKLRRMPQQRCAVAFVRTKNDKELGKVAAYRATGYPASGKADGLRLAVLSAIAEQHSLLKR